MKKRIISLLCIALTVIFIDSADAVEQGDNIPDCQLKNFSDAKVFSLKQGQGKVQYIDFWASWCGPCAKSFPFLNTLHTELKERGLQITAINLDENILDAKEFLAKFPANFAIASDSQEQCAKLFDVQGMPSSYVIDRKGFVRAVHLGFKAGKAEELKMLITQLLAEH
jgi:thiol-disulfide isomerase/thioredoxin